jgi:hypothetical protein
MGNATALRFCSALLDACSVVLGACPDLLQPQMAIDRPAIASVKLRFSKRFIVISRRQSSSFFRLRLFVVRAHHGLEILAVTRLG